MKTDIIPVTNGFYTVDSSSNELDKKAITIFCALGFFLNDETYFKKLKVLKPAHEYLFNDLDEIIKAKPWFQWKYDPRDISFDQATEEYGELFERLARENLSGKKVILPLSGGLDSRSQAAAVKNLSEVHTFSYRFAQSFNETKYGKAIAEANGWPFDEFVIPEEYLWDRIEELALINKGYSEFTHPRQMAVTHHFPDMGDVFYLGHWGDVLFDDMGVPSNLSFDEQVAVVLKKIVKKGGMELATALWQAWGLYGSFEIYLRERIAKLLSEIDIDHAGARIRAFKSLYWAPRWTSVNLAVFSKYHPVFLPYYSDEMCQFICTIPEEYLANRQIQIEYIKRKAPELAAISWQAKAPYNLYDYHKHRTIAHLPYRVKNKLNRVWRDKMQGETLTSRNWEIQFLGEGNDYHLRQWLFEQPSFKEWVPPSVVRQFYQAFKEHDSITYSHPVSMLLTMSVFSKLNKEGKL